MKSLILITILLLSFGVMAYNVCAQNREWHEDCIWECIDKGYSEMQCLAHCEEIATEGTDAGTTN